MLTSRQTAVLPIGPARHPSQRALQEARKGYNPPLEKESMARDTPGSEGV